MSARGSDRHPHRAERVLVIEDDDAVRQALDMLLTSRGYAVSVAGSTGEGIRCAVSCEFDLVVTDLRLQDGSGFDVIAAIKETESCPPVIVMTGFSSVESAVQSLREGAVDYIIKPYDNEEFIYAVGRALNERRMHRENAALKRNLQKAYSGSRIVGESTAVKRVLDLIRRVAPTDATVFIQGESGTGKELVAQAIHAQSGRASAAFVPVNCGAIPGELIESELFGHVKGAFTGATSASDGLIVEAHGGTLFLDEIGELPLGMQVKLLRALQEKEVRPVGGKKTRRIDVRYVAASNKDLKEAMSRSEFREDLFYRLNVIKISVPPLREREGDVNLLVKYFIDFYAKKIGKRIRYLDASFTSFVKSYQWPGNVRELQNLIERAAILTDSDVLNYDDIVDTPLAMNEPLASGDILENPLPVEEYIRNIVLKHQGAHSEIELARMLGIGRKALWVRRRKWATAADSGGAGSV